jgi:hypothetical protein
MLENSFPKRNKDFNALNKNIFEFIDKKQALR